MKMNKVLVIDDEPAICEMLCFTLTRAGYQCEAVHSAEAARASINQEFPLLLLLDWMLPGVSGLEFARNLKRDPATSQLPVIMLTARGEEGDKIRGLDSGADDYITKPFSPKELLARIKAVLRRTTPQATDEVINLCGLQLDPANRLVSVEDQMVPMGPTEFRLLHFFMTHTERVYSRAQVLDQVWGSNVYVEERTVDVHIRRLRKVLQEYGYEQCVQTVRGSGYRFSTRGMKLPDIRARIEAEASLSP
jgi:two-component system phosphate regulon response regulator PhoB